MPGLGFSMRMGMGGVTPTPGLVGFYANGATNSKLKAAFARVAAGTGRAKWLVEGDSTSNAAGAGNQSDASDMTDCRQYRPAAVLASLYSAQGVPMLDNSTIGDGAFQLYQKNSFTGTSAYDPRVAYVKTTANLNPAFAGAAIMYADTGGLIALTLPGCDTFVSTGYISGSPAVPLTIDGAAPASGDTSLDLTTAPTGPYSLRSAVSHAASAGTHTGAVGGAANLRGIYGYNAAVPAHDILVYAVNGSTTADHVASDGKWEGLESAKFDAPDFMITNLGANEYLQGIPVDTYVGNVATLVSAARLSGDVLVIYPHPISAPAGSIAQADYNAALKTWCASNGVPFLSLFEHYGSGSDSTFPARLVDGTHPKRALYADIAAVEKQAIDLMRA